MSHSTQDGQTGRAAARHVRIPFTARVLSVLIIVAAVVVSLWAWDSLRHAPRTDDAFIRANAVGIAPRVSGQIVSICVRDNQAVHEGDLLFEIDPEDYQAHLEQA